VREQDVEQPIVLVRRSLLWDIKQKLLLWFVEQHSKFDADLVILDLDQADSVEF
jgi:hypothetical protein